MAGNEERTIIRIPRKESSQQNGQKRLLRVAAYCRVSTEQEEQESSLKNQVDYYTRLINGNPEWKMAGIYADHGISGVRDTIRPGFMNMIEDCKKHKIDLIMTKISEPILTKYLGLHQVYPLAERSGGGHRI